MAGALFLVSSFFFCTAHAWSETCKPAPEVMYLHDASASLRADSAELFKEMMDMMKYFDQKYTGGVRFGYASWTDKPMPFRGFGSRNTGGVLDRCYSFGCALTSDVEAVREAIKDTFIGYGGDTRENPYEAILDAALDPRSDWTQWDPNAETPDGRMVVRAIVLATDDLPHLPGDAASAVEHFDRSIYPRDIDFPGGFGHLSVLNFSAGVYTCSDPDLPCHPSNYIKLSELIYKNDASPLEGDELAEMQAGIYNFGPPTWPQITPHPGEFDDSLAFCNTHDYPSMASVVNALNQMHITPIILLKKPEEGHYDADGKEQCKNFGFGYPTTAEEYLTCMKSFYAKAFQDAGAEAIVQEYTGANDIRDAIQEVINTVSEMKCDHPDPTGIPIPTSIPADADDDDDHNHTAAIIGGAAGGVAGIAGIAALVYRKVNGGFFTKKASTCEMSSGEVSWPESLKERESLEEVTTDMFQ